MKLFLVSRSDCPDWDEYDSFVVAAESETAARLVHPNGIDEMAGERCRGTWPVNPGLLDVREIGEAAASVKAGEVLIASFNAG